MAANSAAAQAPRPGQDPLDVAFAAMMVRPGDPDRAIAYARIAAERRQPRAAIAALERALRANPGRDDLRLEIASLYLAAGAPAAAAIYAREALASPDIPAEVTPRARELLAQAEAGASRSRFEVTLLAGARYDTNANEATSLGSVPIFVPAFGTAVDVNTPVRGQASWSSVLGARVYHRYDLDLQREGAWETTASAYDQRFASIPRDYDLSILSIDSGPRIGVAEFGEDGPTLALRPFVSATWIGYAGQTYAWFYGGGLTAELRLSPSWSVEVTWLGRQGDYEGSSFRPTAALYTGFEWNAAASLTWTPGASTRVSASMLYYDAAARAGNLSRSALGAFLTANTDVAVAGATLGVSARVGVRRVSYDSADSFLDPGRARRDTRWEGGISVLLPVAPAVAVALEYDWYSQDSNQRIYRYDNNAVTLGLRVRI
ncbi:surface lipoprotein assembly modifier [Plastoroseomonas arctica]|uniref:DUF560 domain-containing protein n=1 Tax=Plastoroseomonas arctica TaxID=1509237 RepID=A0AAF1JZI4_9PROT|nr:DUF560 domain-containing protein [Plastoroseomonas arctica]